jgi:hypothetical protein
MTEQVANRLAVYGMIAAVGVLGAVSDVILNQWARTGRLSWLLGAYASWIIVATLLGVILRSGYFGFGVAVVLFLLANTLAALWLDYQFFAGRLSGLSWLGMVLAIAAMACLELGRPAREPPGDPAGQRGAAAEPQRGAA